MESQPFYSIADLDSKEFQKTLQPSDLVHSKALLTHCLHNIRNGVAEHYKKGAEKIFKKYVEFKNEQPYSNEVHEQAIQKLLFEVENVPFPTPRNYSFKFIDLFAGAGGFRIALQNLGGKCVFSSEWNLDAQKTYVANFGEVPFWDITSKDTKKSIPGGGRHTMWRISLPGFFCSIVYLFKQYFFKFHTHIMKIEKFIKYLNNFAILI